MLLSYWHPFFASHTLSFFFHCGNWKSMGVVVYLYLPLRYFFLAG